MAKRRWAAALAAVATLAAGMAAPVAQADGSDDPNAAVPAAKAAYDRAVSDRDALKPARDKAQATLDEGTIGYFRARGSTDAVRILTDDGTLTGHDYASDIRKMKNEGSSDTRLDSMLRGLKAIRQMNKFRAEEGTSPKVSDYPDRGGKQLKPLLVTDGLMAVAEAHGDRNYVDSGSTTHYGDFSNEAENICGDWEDGMAACYYGEKEQFNGVDSNGAGHYLNIVNDELQYAGSGDLVQDFSMASDPLYVTQRQYWDNTFSQGRVMSVDDYEADVEAYKAPLDKAVSDYDNAAKAADNAKTAYDRAKAAADAWNNAMFTVSFDTGGGSDVKAQTVRRGGTVSKPTDPTRAGYLFGGWYQGDAKYDFSTPVSADLTLSAHWRAYPSAKVFTVSFDPGNGQMVSGRSVRAGQAISEPKAPTRSGYSFDGWYTARTGGSKYDFSTPVTADLNLYAHWTAVAPKTFTVSFDTAGGSKVASQKVEDGAKASRPADPTRSGYSFDGWYKGGSKYDFSTPVTADVTLTARWKAVSEPAVRNGWVVEDGVRHWYENGRMARSHAFYDRASDAWYWADADGSIARDKDVFIPKDESDRSKGGKWVRFDKESRMVKGEQHSTKAGHVGWYYFDPTTGEMAKGMRYVPSNGGKWVYYDATTGIMAHGERYVDYDAAHTGWYYFDPTTGKMTHGDVYVRSNGGKWVRYDRTTGIMVHGLQRQDGSWYYFDQKTGAMAHGRTWVPEWHAWHEFDRVTGRG